MLSAPRLVNGLFYSFLGLSSSPLNSADEFIFLAFLETKVIIREFRPFLFQFAFSDIPIALHLQHIHNNRISLSSFLSQWGVFPRNVELQLFGGAIPSLNRIRKRRLSSRVTRRPAVRPQSLSFVVSTACIGRVAVAVLADSKHVLYCAGTFGLLMRRVERSVYLTIE